MHTDSYLLCTERLRKKVQIDFHFHRKSSDMDDGMTGFYMKSSGHHVNNGGSTGGGNNCNSGAKCGRWNPTTEQVKVLTDLFRSGLRTPSTDQIQKISSQLSFYGKIESKNVFYWFQNHKARERQKRRKVSVDEKDVLRRLDKFSSKKHYLEVNHVSADEPERVIETLQLFPLNSFEEEEPQKLRLHANECRESKTTFSYKIGTEIDPPLDLRLSFL